MKLSINKSAKRVISIALAMVMLVGTLFTAGVTVSVSANTNNIDQWDGGFDTTLTGSGTAADPYLITNAEELAAVCYGKATGSKTGAYFKVSGVSEFYMDSVTAPATVKGFASAAQVESHYKNLSSTPANWNPNTSVKVNFDGNGATIYGLYMNSVERAGLFSMVTSGTVVKNVAIKNSYAYSTSYSGFVAGQSDWNDAGDFVVENCIIVNNFSWNTSGNTGEIVGHAGNEVLKVNNCLVADNDLDYTANAGSELPFQYFCKYADATNCVITNCLAIGVVPKIREKTTGTVSNNYWDNKYLHSNDNSNLTGITTIANAGVAKGLNAKSYLVNFNWADDTQSGEGYWHAVVGGYPLPIKPEGWEYIVLKPVWNGTAATSFARGSGIESDPYIIETAEQLYKMVRDGGKQSDGTAAYYKVADGVNDLYLNDVQVGDLNTLKSMVSSGAAKNWTKDFDGNVYKQDANNDGLCDEDVAFTGVFDGNGVTIHGLYSTNKSVTGIGWAVWAVGFVPALKYDAVIKNVNFDKSYIENTSVAYSGVITCSFGISEAFGLKVDDVFVAYGNAETTTNATISNVVVRNTYMPASEGNSDSGGGWCKAGFIGVHSGPKSVTFTNCVYDGVGSEMLIRSDAADNRAGIYMVCGSNANNASLANCLSVGIQPVATSTSKCNAKFVNCYTTATTFTENSKDDEVAQITEYDSQDDMPLLNWGVWSIATVENGRKLPMPGITKGGITGYAAVKDMLRKQVSGAGLFSYVGVYEKGTYGLYDTLIGSGTEEDPYLISTPVQLATAIAAGGVNVNEKLYYKLTNDINLGSIAWIDTDPYLRESEGFYEYLYTPFKGTLDGDGYTIYELNATATNSGALIPELAGGTVKNLNIRNSAADVAIFAKGNGSVENCSATDCYVATEGGALVSGGATAKNSVFNDTYYLENGEVGTATLDGETWYGIVGKTPHLVSNAKTMPCADVDGDGKGDSYGAADLTALRNKLLKKQDYKYVYGDVNKDGKINLTDLVTLSRINVDDYGHVRDGFWRNLELNNIKIYYGENDNYDAARRLELYLEAAVSNVDIQKVVSAQTTVTGENSDKTAVYVHANDTVGSPDGKLEIIVGNIANYEVYSANTKATATNSYAITYDKENGVLWLQGDNFTAVEQAVLDFINNSDAKTSTVYTVDSATLATEKQPVTINGTTYYYTWGDEFSGEELLGDNWMYSQMGSETAYENGTHLGKYVNLEHPFNKDLDELYVVEDGKLTIKRGAYVDSDSALNIAKLDAPTIGSDGYAYNEVGNKIDEEDIYVTAGDIMTQKSLLVKQGYFEFKASLPSDGHAFMSWWMMGCPTGGNNNAYANSLYGKIYKLNPNYNGVNAMNSQNAKETYKYQLPNAYFEIDIIELMQDITNLSSSSQKSHMTGVYDYDLPLNIHKYVDTGANASNGYKYSVLDWSTGVPQMKSFTLLEGSKYSSSNYKTVTSLTVDGSTDIKDGILSSRVKDHSFGTNESRAYDATAQAKLTAMRRYGFEWEVVTDSNGVGTSATYTLYVWDPDGDGESSATDYTKYSFTCDKTTSSITYNEAKDTYKIIGKTYYTDLYYLNQLIPDCEVSNQYMHFIIDNIYYVANQYNNNANFTDLLSYENADKTTLDIEYMRVYQQDGKRDIITPETESFNNGNHFGY
ncbi:MAG: hypothetical protein IKU82_03345 [Clostridia bacterium]|nr:hypothetical protein [Clostridia bacterium]